MFTWGAILMGSTADIIVGMMEGDRGEPEYCDSSAIVLYVWDLSCNDVGKRVQMLMWEWTICQHLQSSSASYIKNKFIWSVSEYMCQCYRVREIQYISNKA